MSATLTEAPAFNALDAKTWPVLLTTEQVAAIFQITPGQLNRRVCVGQFQPMPKDDKKPRRWRRIDVLRATGEAEATR